MQNQVLDINKLNFYELEQNAQRECMRRTRKAKKSHTLRPEHLKTGFGLHAISSLELAIKRARAPKHICLCLPCDDGEAGEAHFEGVPMQESFMVEMAQERLKYLMGLSTAGEEEAVSEHEDEGAEHVQSEDNLINGGSEAMRRAQRYLREHKIFEFFQYLIAHLLAEIPYDPIGFLINLLDKCLIYRSGICDAPLLYQKKHVECLFNLMDRMRTGYVDYNQYKTGMMTLGIKSFNPKPPMTSDRLVTKLYFCEEAIECMKDLLNDMLRKRTHEVKKSKKKVPKAPPPSTTRSVCPSQSHVDLFV